MEFFISLLVVAVLWLWSRVASLSRKLEQLEDSLIALSAKRSAPEAPAQAAQPLRGEAPRNESPPAPARAPIPTAAPGVTERRPAPPPPAPPVQAQSQSAPPEEFLPARLVREYFTGGNLVVRVGIIVLFFGVAFLLKYAAEHVQLSIKMRLIGVTLGAFGLFALGWRLRDRRRGFSLALQGGAIGVLYLTLFAALRLYGLLPPGATFALMAALGVISCLLAVRQDALAMAVLGATGGFLAPVLASTGQGSHVTLFSYYALLNVFVVAQAWFKAWRPLNLVAFVFTFGVGAFWGVTRYEPSQFATTEPFLLFFFAAFVAIAILFAFRSAPQLTHYVDGTLVFGTPVVAMAMQMELVRDMSHGRAWSALVAGIVYLGLAAWLHRTQRDTLRLLKESFLAVGIAFLTLAVPLWLDDTWTAATWALEGAALVWIGLRQSRWLPTVCGALLQLAAAVAWVVQNDASLALIPVANAHCVGALLLSIAGLLSARVATQPDSILKPLGQLPSHVLLVWGLGWWFYASGHEVQEFAPAVWQAGAFLGLFAVTALACGVLVRPLAWPALRVPALLLLPLMVLAAGAYRILHLHPFSEGGWLAWPVAFAVMWVNLWWHETSLQDRTASVLHGVSVWLLGLLISWELVWQVQQISAPGSAWAGVAWGIVPTLMLALLAGELPGKWWPLRSHPGAFRSWIALGIAVFLALWSLWLNWTSNGAAAPLPYLPLVNPLDIAVGFALLLIARWLVVLWRADPALFHREEQSGMIGVLAGTAFVWLNAVLFRTLHHWRGVPYQIEALAADTEVQAALSIFWTLLALGTMLWANRTGLRVVWFVGAGLMAVVVAKLFLVDLAHIGTLARIVSFLVTGGLMLVIGYFSPLPPVKSRAAA
jgi:uncharacterized membrane protein